MDIIFCFFPTGRGFQNDFLARPTFTVHIQMYCKSGKSMSKPWKRQDETIEQNKNCLYNVTLLQVIKQLTFHLFKRVDIKYKSPMTGFEPMVSRFRSNRSFNYAQPLPKHVSSKTPVLQDFQTPAPPSILQAFQTRFHSISRNRDVPGGIISLILIPCLFFET